MCWVSPYAMQRRQADALSLFTLHHVELHFRPHTHAHTCMHANTQHSSKRAKLDGGGTYSKGPGGPGRTKQEASPYDCAVCQNVG
jgi:hypothetical protein